MKIQLYYKKPKEICYNKVRTRTFRKSQKREHKKGVEVLLPNNKI